MTAGARETRDAVVVGLGVTGSAAARELARRGLSVLGIDRHGPDHRLGSSHGESRLIRALYHEGAHYVRLLRRTRRAWRELEDRTGRELLAETGGLAVGPPGGELVAGCRETAARGDVACEELTADDLRRRFPAFRLPEGCRALLDPAAGVLRADRCLAALRDGAREAGAELRFRDPVEEWTVREDGLRLRTGSGPVHAGAVLLAAGGWTPSLLETGGEAGEGEGSAKREGRTRLPLTVERQTVHHFRPGPEPAYGPDRFPVFLFETGDGATAYGAPDLGSGVKVALHHGGEEGARPEEVRRPAGASEGRNARAAVDVLLPGLGDDPVSSQACIYANTPDRDFVIDRLASEGPPVVVAAGFSGHGFKFAPAVAEAAADLLCGSAPAVDLSPFRLDRWQEA